MPCARRPRNSPTKGEAFMEVSQAELNSIVSTSSAADVSYVSELSELQLALVGGGIAELVGV
jgi:hypothetical protein